MQLAALGLPYKACMLLSSRLRPGHPFKNNALPWGHPPGEMALHASAKSRALITEANRAVAREVGTL